MNSLIQFKTITRPLLIALVLACFAFLLKAQATDLDSVLPDGNTADGSGVLIGLTTGANNSGFGFQALHLDTAGGANTAIGFNALFTNTTGSANTAIGYRTLYYNTGDFNTANGVEALFNNTTGAGNTADGFSALGGNTTGSGNTAIGESALESNETGSANTAIGDSALLGNTTGHYNTAIGSAALQGGNVASNVTGDNNTASGYGALFFNTTGSNNTANGYKALFNNTSGNDNITLGFGAGGNLTTGDNNIDIGNQGVADEADTIRIGTTGTQTNAYIAGIYNATVAKGLGVVVDSAGHLGTKGSSERFKEAIKPMDKASEAILALKPVTFHYKKELDPEGSLQFGLVAEQVEKVNPDLVASDRDGKPYTVRYEAVNAMLLNEFLKEHRKVEKLEGALEAVKKCLKEQDAKIQKVRAQLEASKPSPQMVENNQ